MPFETKIAQLQEMGFLDHVSNHAALTQTMGNIDATIQVLLRKTGNQNLHDSKSHKFRGGIPLASIFTQDCRTLSQTGIDMKNKRKKIDNTSKRQWKFSRKDGSADFRSIGAHQASTSSVEESSCTYPASEVSEPQCYDQGIIQPNIHQPKIHNAALADVVDLDSVSNAAVEQADVEAAAASPISIIGTTAPIRNRFERIPLAERMRPTMWEHFIGQTKIRDFVKNFSTEGIILSAILWGPPGCGKTSVARIIGEASGCSFHSLSAESCGVTEIKQIIARSKSRFSKYRTLLFIDEIHRLNKLQQDVFLPAVESGDITLIGATTENPSFSINKALLSRCRVLLLDKLNASQIHNVLERAVNDHVLGVRASICACEESRFNSESPASKHETSTTFTSISTSRLAPINYDICIEDRVLDSLATLADGDARVALNALDVAVLLAFRSRPPFPATPCDTPPEPNRDKLRSGQLNLESADTHDHCSARGGHVITVTMEHARKALQRTHIQFDAKGDEHFNHISALHKSIRGSDVQASVYWLARMLEGGEDPVYVGRRLVRAASEDIGMEDPMALQQATCALSACQNIGMPECSAVLTQCVIYLASAPKSRAVDDAYAAAKQCVMTKPLYPVPLHLRNAPTKFLQQLGWGPQLSEAGASFLPEPLRDHVFYKQAANRQTSPAF